MPRYIIIVKASEKGEDYGQDNATEMFEEMGKFNEEMVAAGVMLSGDGLQPSANDGYRVRFSNDGSEPQVQKGPFDPRNNLMGGWWVIKTKDAEEALGWAKRIPFKEGEVEIRRISELEDFSGVMTEEQMDKEKKLMAKLEEKHQKD